MYTPPEVAAMVAVEYDAEDIAAINDVDVLLTGVEAIVEGGLPLGVGRASLNEHKFVVVGVLDPEHGFIPIGLALSDELLDQLEIDPQLITAINVTADQADETA